MALRVVGAPTTRHRLQMKRLGEFLGLAEIRYRDLGNGEDYVLITERHKRLILKIRAHRDQGGFLVIDCGLKPVEMEP